MTNEELIAWGRVENTMRLQDIAEAKVTGNLKAAQEAARLRRNAAGLTADEAAAAVSMAQRWPQH